MLILGLDVSTSVVGVCVYDPNPQMAGWSWISSVRLLDRIEFRGCRTFWEKVDKVSDYLDYLGKVHPVISRLAIEEPLMGFRTGMSSAQTITQLMRFNGIVSHLARKRFGAEPEYISSSHARKLVGVKLQRTSIVGVSGKEQVFAHMALHDLKGYPWPTKKDGITLVDWSRDATDAYVVARAASLEPMTPSVPIVPKPRSKRAKAV